MKTANRSREEQQLAGGLPIILCTTILLAAQNGHAAPDVTTAAPARPTNSVAESSQQDGGAAAAAGHAGRNFAAGGSATTKPTGATLEPGGSATSGPGTAHSPEKDTKPAANLGPTGPISWCRTLVLALTICLAYWIGTVVVRWNRIAHPTRELLRAQIYALGREVDLLDQAISGLKQIRDLLEKARELLDDGQTKSGRFADILFWSRGKELTGWGYVHEAEVRLAPFLAAATVEARLEMVERKLRNSGDATSVALADSVRDSFTAKYSDEPTRQARLRALLAEALSVNYDREDTSFADLLSWQNKAAWLVAIGLLLIVVLCGWDPVHSVFFLFGAVGGLLSRLSRSLDRKDVPTDYGASWTTLFLSPVAGALGAWSGVVVSELAVQLGVLGKIFEGFLVKPPSDLALAAALIFGFSERLLDEVLDKVAGKVVAGQTTGKNGKNPPAAAAPGAPAAAPAPPAPAPGAPAAAPAAPAPAPGAPPAARALRPDPPA